MIEQLRLIGMLGFLLGMPVLAIPQVNGWLEETFLGSDPPTAERPGAEQSAVARERLRVDQPGPPDVPSAPRDSNPPPSPPPQIERLPPPDSTEAAPDLVPVPHPAAPPASATLEFDQLQRRLRDLGATYWHLEAFTTDQVIYRFECRVPLPGHETFERAFVGEADQSEQAMRTAVEQAEAWRTGQQNRRPRPDAANSPAASVGSRSASNEAPER